METSVFAPSRFELSSKVKRCPQVVFSRKFSAPRKGCLSLRIRSQATSTAEKQPGRPALLLECDGVVVDLHMDGHRVAFNKAFQELGYDCVQWGPAVYHDLLRSGDGTAEGIVSSYFNTVGWPVVLPSRERREFAVKIHELKRKHLQSMVDNVQLPLREGVLQFIDEVIAGGVPLGIVAGTASTPKEGVVNAVMQAMGPARASYIRVFSFGDEGDEDTDYDTSSSDEDVWADSSVLEQRVAAAQARMKKENAQNFVNSMGRNGGRWGGLDRGIGLSMDPALLAAEMRGTLISPQLLQACIMTMGASSSASAFLSSHNWTMKAANGAGMLTVALPPSLSRRGKYGHADCQFDGFGYGGGISWARLKLMLNNRMSGRPAQRRR